MLGTFSPIVSLHSTDWAVTRKAYQQNHNRHELIGFLGGKDAKTRITTERLIMPVENWERFFFLVGCKEGPIPYGSPYHFYRHGLFLPPQRLSPFFLNNACGLEYMWIDIENRELYDSQYYQKAKAFLDFLFFRCVGINVRLEQRFEVQESHFPHFI